MAEIERIKTPEACRITGLCERTLQSLSARGEVWGAAKLGKRWTYDRQRLRAWVMENENAVANRRTSMSGMGSSMPALKLTDESVENRLRRALDEKLNAGLQRG